MKVAITFELSEDDRIAIAALYGREPVASRAAVVSWIRATVRSTLESVRAEHEECLAPED